MYTSIILVFCILDDTSIKLVYTQNTLLTKRNEKRNTRIILVYTKVVYYLFYTITFAYSKYVKNVTYEKKLRSRCCKFEKSWSIPDLMTFIHSLSIDPSTSKTKIKIMLI